MSAQSIDGKAVAAKLRGEVAIIASTLRERGVTPTLAVVLVGDDPGQRRGGLLRARRARGRKRKRHADGERREREQDVIFHRTTL